MKYVLSFDIAKGKSVYCLINKDKVIVIEPTQINYNKNEFDILLLTIKKHKNLIIVMNSKLVKQFKDTLINLKLIN